QQASVADLADVELEWVGGLRLGFLDLLDLIDLVGLDLGLDRVGNDLEPSLGLGFGKCVRKRPLRHAGSIGTPPPSVEACVHPLEGSGTEAANRESQSG